MKKYIACVFLVLCTVTGFAQIRTLERPIQPEKYNGPNIANSVADTISVYISLQDGVYKTEDLYGLFRGENPKIALYHLITGDKTTTAFLETKNKVDLDGAKWIVPPVNNLFTNLQKGFTTIWFRVVVYPPTNSNSKLIIIPCVNSNELKNKNLVIEAAAGKNMGCVGTMGNLDNVGIANNYTSLYKIFDAKNSACPFIKSLALDKTVRFVIRKPLTDR